MARIYLDKATVTNDLALFYAASTGQALNLSMFPKLAADRWPWLVDRWYTELYDQFLTQAAGDDYLLAGLKMLDNHVVAWRNGVRINPLLDMSKFLDVSEFLANIDLTSMNLTNPEAEFIQEQIKVILEMSAEDFINMKKYLREQRSLAFDSIGMPDATFNAYAARQSIAKEREFFVSDLDQINDVIDLESYVDGILYDFKRRKDIEPDLLTFANEQLELNESGVRVDSGYQSFTAVPFEQSLEQMARDYLGNASFWYELVTVNKLKPPYVDKFGTKVYLSENASSNTVRVPGAEKHKFPVGASIKVGSRIVPDQIRKVEVFIDNNDGSITLSLSGAQDLNKLKVEHQAYIRVYEPETARDYSFIKIPTSLPSPYKDEPEPTRSDLRQIDVALYSFGVDILRDDTTGDLIIGSNGDFGLAFGLPAVTQAVRGIVSTELGELPLHPAYGLPNSIGFILSPEETTARIATLVQTAIDRDPRFTNIEIEEINISAEGKISLSLKVQVAGTNDLIPLAFVI